MSNRFLSSLGGTPHRKEAIVGGSREQQRLVRAALDETPLGIAVANLSGHLVDVNQQFSRLLGYEGDELIGEAIIDLTHPADRERTAMIFASVLQDGGVRRYTKRCLTKDGDVIWSRVTMSLMPRDGERYVLAMVENITDLVAAETALERRNAQQEALAEISQRALQRGPVDGLFDFACVKIAATLEANYSQVLLSLAEERFVLSAAWGWKHTRVGTIFNQRELKGVLSALERGPAILSVSTAGDLAALTGAHIAVKLGSGIAAPIGSGKKLDGLLAAHSYAPDAFSDDDMNFLSSVANLLAQALDRERADAELLRRNSLQLGAAEFARRALTRAPEGVAEDACQVVQRLLGAEFAAYFELDDAGERLKPMAGDSPLHELDSIRVDERTHLGRASRAHRVLTVGDFADLTTTTRDRLVSYGMRSGMAVAVRDERRTYGVLATYSTKASHFGVAEEHFLESIGTALAESLSRHAAQRALIDSEERYRTVVEGASEIIYTLDREGRFVAVNPAFGRLTGWETNTLLGTHFSTILDADDARKGEEAFQRVAEGNPISDLELRVATADGGWVLIETSASGVFREGELVAVHGFSRDVTQKRQLEARLEQANRINSLGRLAATVAHEFNNVLMGILPFLEVLRRDDPQSRAKAIERISTSVRRGKRVTEEILRFARPSPPIRTRLSAREMLVAIRSEMEPVLGKGYTIDLGEVADAWIDVDPNQIHQVLTNLLLNSRDAMPAGGTIRVMARVEPKENRFRQLLHPADQFLHVIVRDEGVGIAPDSIAHVFEPLFTTKRHGHGLGLAVAHQVIRNHDGEIFVESTVGVGTTFHLFLPLAAGEKSERTAAAALQSGVASLPAKTPIHRLLLVEDDVNVSAGLSELLRFEGIEVEEVATGGEVMPALERWRPDAIVLDIGLPDIEGTEVYRRIATVYPEMPVVFSTGHGDERKLGPYLTRPNVAMLLKPYDVTALLAVLNEVRQGS